MAKLGEHIQLRSVRENCCYRYKFSGIIELFWFTIVDSLEVTTSR